MANVRFVPLQSVIKSADPFWSVTGSSYTSSKVVNAAGEVVHPYLYEWVYACVTAITSNAIQLKLRTRKKGERGFTSGSNLKLDNLLDNPNQLQSHDLFFENILNNLLVPSAVSSGGIAYVTAGITGLERGFDFSKGKIPFSLMVFGDKQLQAKFSSSGNLIGYAYMGTGVMLSPGEVLPIRLQDPSNPIFGGVAPYAAVSDSVRLDKKVEGLNESIVDNGGSLSGILYTDDEVDTLARSEVEKVWKEKVGGRNAGSTPVLGNGLKYQEIAKSNKDMQYTEQRDLTLNRVLAAYKVPRFMLAMYEDINFATSESARKTFWNECILPLVNRVTDALNSFWVSKIDGGRWEIYGDYSAVEVLQDNILDKIDQAKKLHLELSFPLDYAFEYVGLSIDTSRIPWAKSAFKQSGMVDLSTGETLGYSFDDSGVDNPIDDPSASSKSSKVDRSLLNERYHKMLKTSENEYFKEFQALFTRQRNQALAKVDSWLKEYKGVCETVNRFAVNTKQVVINSEMFFETMGKELNQTQAIQSKLSAKQVRRSYLHAKDSLGGELFLWADSQAFTAKIFNENAKAAAEINTTTFKAANKSISLTIEDAIKNFNGRSLKDS